MTLLRSVLFFAIFLAFLCIAGSSHAIDLIPQNGVCEQEAEQTNACAELLTPTEEKSPERSQPPETRQKAGAPAAESPAAGNHPHQFTVYFFWGRGCPHCEEEKVFLSEMKKQYPGMKVMDYEVWYDEHNAELLRAMAAAYKMKASGVPVTFISENAFIGFSSDLRVKMTEAFQTCISHECADPGQILSGKLSIEAARNMHKPKEPSEGAEHLECTEKNRTVHVPWIGNLDASRMSLPAITLVIAGLDSFNPCAFFVLLSLLGLLIHAQSRKKMFFIGSIFVFFSGFVYFVFMAAWLNLFLFMGQVEIITRIAGSIAVVIAVINIKDFFFFRKGVSLNIPDSAKPKLFDRMRRLMKSTSFISMFIGTVVLAIAANSYELLCTAGFPMVFTRILTLNNLDTFSYYGYLILYNLIYVIPLSVIVIIFTITLGKKQLTEWQGRLMKLISGTMMIGLGGVLLFNPAVLSNAFISFLILSGALVVSFIIAFVTKKLRYS
ncbi:MAG: hypothetical protein AB1552_04405 [Nitrospirota bacterium]